jgi:hypothetical protein
VKSGPSLKYTFKLHVKEFITKVLHNEVKLYRCLTLNGNKIKHVSSTMKCIGKIDTFSNIGPHEVSYVLIRSKLGTISGIMHMKTIFNFLPGVGKYFTGNTFCSSEISVTHLIHVLHFIMLMSFINPQKIKSREVTSGE